MIFKEFRKECISLTESAIKSLSLPEEQVELSEPPRPELGDLSTSVAIRLSRKLNKIPFEVAKSICENISGKRYLDSAEPHQSGYINFRINYESFIYDSLKQLMENELSLLVRSDKRKTIVIEHTAVNPNKGLHIGHARNLFIGDSLARIFSFLGHDVRVLNYIDDSGAQVADIIVGFKFLNISEETDKKFDLYCGDYVYARVNKEYEINPALKEKQAFVLREIEKGDTEIAEYTRKIVQKVVNAQLQTCWMLNAYYDILNWESQIVHSGMWNELFALMKQNGIAYYVEQGENKGCWVMKDDSGNEKVLVRSDGTAVYVAKDIPYAAWKLGLVSDPFLYYEFGIQPNGKVLLSTSLEKGSKLSFKPADLSITVIDVRQANLQRMVKYVLGKIFSKEEYYLHRGYEVVSISRRTAEQMGLSIASDFVHMSGRKGVYINADAFFDLLKKKAAEETRKRNKGESEEWVQSISEIIALAAMRYEMLKQDPEKMIVFDLDSSLMLQGDTGPYLLYSYARASRIIEKASSEPVLTIEGCRMMNSQEEKKLAKIVSSFDLSLEKSVDFLSPSLLAHYAFSLCDCFNEFYERLPVLQERNKELREARICLVSATRKVLGSCLDLLGIKRSERI